MSIKSLSVQVFLGASALALSLAATADNDDLQSAQRFDSTVKKPAAVTKTAFLAGGDERTVYTEQSELIRAPRAIAALGPDLFGDKVNLYHGNLEFVHDDVTIPGNFPLSVSVGRRLTTGSLGNEYKGHFRNWELEIPRIHGIYSTQYGFQKLSGSTPSVARCTNFGAPPPVYQSGTSGARFRSTEYWNGNMLYIPGKGDQEILARNASGMPVIPTNGAATPLVTRDLWAVQCVGSLASTTSSTPANETGEGFKAISPDGTTYLFNWLVSRPINPLSKGVPVGSSTAHFTMQRTEVWILPTVVTDRFGNTVTYNYDATDKWKLNSIVASDGRTINLTYQPGTHVIQSVTDGTRTWNYGYATSQFGGTMLSTVTLPDSSSWQLAGLDGLPGQQGLLDARIIYRGPSGSEDPDCDSQPGEMDSSIGVGSMVHPSGATGTFTITPESHGRSMVPKLCYTDDPRFPGHAYYPRYVDNYALTQKTISGPGLPSMTWSTRYDTFYPSWDNCDCYTNAYVSVTDPKGVVTRYTFGNSFYVAGRANYPVGKPEGELLATDVGWNGSSAVSTTTIVYEDSLPAVGTSEQNRGDFTSTGRPIPQKQRTVSQQGVNFNWQVATADFDNMARVRKATLSSTLGMSRTESTVYKDYTDKWVMSQVLSVTDGSGAVPVANTYDDARAGALSTRRLFGKLQMTLGHNADGTLATYADGLNQTTTYTNYKRGLAQNIAYPPGLGSESAVVNNIGNITSRTDAAGFSTSYGYDAMGRLNLVVPQIGSATGLTLAYIGSDEYGIGAGHWRQSIITANAVKATYFDALLRPAVIRSYDSANIAGTASTVLQRFDHQGQVVFASYPKTDIAGINDNQPGTATQYDELQRVTLVAADSELGVLNTTTTYLNGFITQVLDAGGHTSSSGYQAFDKPTEAAVTSVSLPEGVSIAIARDSYAKPTSITRSGSGKTATRSYVYDANQLLCKTIEPEIGATVQQLDLANNVSWKASGLALPSISSCDQASVPAASKVSYTYDGLNRLKNTNFSDGSPNIARTYTPDGLLATVNTDGATPTAWTLGYDARRILNDEKLVFGGVTYDFVRGIDFTGNLSQLTYPGSASFPATTVVSFAPNALGQPGKISSAAGTYANGISYHPNGAVQGFTYGNGIVRNLTQNVRGLPQIATDGSMLNDTYYYDQDGNVLAIADGTANGMSRSNMVYDGLHRLTSVNAPGMWGTATYAYDALDNLTSSTVGGRTSLHNYDNTKNRLTSISSNVSAYNLSYGYDVQGNINQRGTQAFVFDQGNRIKSATGKETYAYDGFGHRVQELAADGTKLIQIYSSGGQLLMASQTGGGKPAKDTKYVYLNRHVLAEIEVAGATTVSYNHTDALGSPIAKTNAAGARTALTKYEPYGMTLAGSTTPTIGFTGHVNDADTGLTYMQQRYFDPVAGRFLSMDPVLTDANSGNGFNRYAYGNNSPYKYVDPDGRFAFLIPLIPYVASATVAIVGHYALPGRQAREDTVRKVGNAILNHGNKDTPTITPGTKDSDKGCIYCVPGDKTSSGNDYIGSTDDMDQRKRDKSDGRDREGARIVGEYDKGNRDERRNKEQQAINDHGGVGNLDNRRNERAEKKWPANGIKPPTGQ